MCHLGHPEDIQLNHNLAAASWLLTMQLAEPKDEYSQTRWDFRLAKLVANEFLAYIGSKNGP